MVRSGRKDRAKLRTPEYRGVRQRRRAGLRAGRVSQRVFGSAPGTIGESAPSREGTFFKVSVQTLSRSLSIRAVQAPERERRVRRASARRKMGISSGIAGCGYRRASARQSHRASSGARNASPERSRGGGSVAPRIRAQYPGSAHWARRARGESGGESKLRSAAAGSVRIRAQSLRNQQAIGCGFRSAAVNRCLTTQCRGCGAWPIFT